MNLPSNDVATTRPAFPPAVDETAALRAFVKALRRSLSGWLGTLKLLRLEPVWLPFALVSAKCGAGTEATRLCCLVDRIEGSVFGLERQIGDYLAVLIEREPANHVPSVIAVE